MHLIFNKFLNQIRKSSTGNFTLEKSHETTIILTFADLCISFSVMHCTQNIKIHSINDLPSVYYMPRTTLKYNSQQNKNAWPQGAYMYNTYFKSLYLIYLFFHSSLHFSSELITKLPPHCNLYYPLCCL